MSHPALSKRTLFVFVLILSLVAGLVFASAHKEKPKSVIHVVTVNWADGASKEDIQKALDGVHTLAEEYDGITRVWTRSIKSQTKDAAFVMEFKDEKALADYAGSDAQKKWYEVYMPVRGQSVTSDITN